MDPYFYDYDNQCWIVDGKVDTCGHPETMDCQCYSRLHAGEPATNEQVASWEDRMDGYFGGGYCDNLAFPNKD